MFLRYVQNIKLGVKCTDKFTSPNFPTQYELEYFMSTNGICDICKLELYIGHPTTTLYIKGVIFMRPHRRVSIYFARKNDHAYIVTKERHVFLLNYLPNFIEFTRFDTYKCINFTDCVYGDYFRKMKVMKLF